MFGSIVDGRRLKVSIQLVNKNCNKLCNVRQARGIIECEGHLLNQWNVSGCVNALYNRMALQFNLLVQYLAVLSNMSPWMGDPINPIS